MWGGPEAPLRALAPLRGGWDRFTVLGQVQVLAGREGHMVQGRRGESAEAAMLAWAQGLPGHGPSSAEASIGGGSGGSGGRGASITECGASGCGVTCSVVAEAEGAVPEPAVVRYGCHLAPSSGVAFSSCVSPSPHSLLARMVLLAAML